MSIGPSFLGGAQNRLLPMSVPFRFFIAGGVFHILFWGMVGLNAEAVSDFEGGLGTALSAVHVLTLGVFLMTAVGASLQLLPVATRRATRAVWPAEIISLLLIGGVPILVWGMAVADVRLALSGGGAVSVGLLIYIVLIGENLFQAKGLGPVIAFAWAALASLIALSGLGLSLVLDFELGLFADHSTVAGVHFVLAVFGFMGLLAFGFSFILIPMFALAGSVANRRGYLILGVSVLAIALACGGIMLKKDPVIESAFLSGLIAAVIYVCTMFGLLKAGMRKRLGIPFILVRSSWVMLPVSLVMGAVIGTGWISGLGWTVFGFAVLVGWLLTFLLGIVLRITPFLASMHSTLGEGRPARLSSLTPEWPQKVLVVCHPLAFVVVGGGIIVGQGIMVEVGAGIGVIGALALLAYIVDVTRRLAYHRRTG